MVSNARYESLRSEIGPLGDRVGRYKAETYAARAQVHRTGAAMFGAGRRMFVAVGCRMGEVALCYEMHSVFEGLTHPRDEGPEKHRRDSNCCEAFHSD